MRVGLRPFAGPKKTGISRRVSRSDRAPIAAVVATSQCRRSAANLQLVSNSKNEVIMIDIALWFVLAMCLIAASISDWRTREISNGWSATILIVGAARAFMIGDSVLPSLGGI